jgi:large subunit ribosomal protein L22
VPQTLRHCVPPQVDQVLFITVVMFSLHEHVAESFVGKGVVFKGMRRHARGRIGKVEYFHCNYFVRLEEGTPPKDYYHFQRQLTGPELLDKWLQQMRNRKIPNSL